MRAQSLQRGRAGEGTEGLWEGASGQPGTPRAVGKGPGTASLGAWGHP